MASRFTQQKPDPAIGRNIRRARRGTPSEKAKGFVVAVSLAATLMGTALFAHADAQSAAAQAAGTAAVATAPAQSSSASNAIPVLSGLEGLWTALTGGTHGS